MGINELKKTEVIIEFKSKPCQIIFSQHFKTAQGQAFLRTKIKNLITGQVLGKTFTSSDKIKKANLKKLKLIFFFKKEML